MKYVITFILVIILLAVGGFLIYNALNSPTPSDNQNNNQNNTNTNNSNTNNSGTNNQNNQNPSNPNNNSADKIDISSDQVSVNAGVFTKGQTKVIELFATPPANSKEARVRVRAVNMEIIKYEEPDKVDWSSIKVGTGCSNIYTRSNLCIDLVKTSANITYGESLGKITVRFTATGAGILEFVAGNGYMVNGKLVTLTGIFATYQISRTGNLPSTAVVSKEVDMIIVGFLVVLTGIYLVYSGLAYRLALNVTGRLGLSYNSFGNSENPIMNWLQQQSERTAKRNAQRNLQKMARPEEN